MTQVKGLCLQRVRSADRMDSDTSALAAANRRGVLAISASMACFIGNDTLVKVVSETLPASQLIFIRGAMAALLLVVAAQATGSLGRARSLIDGRVTARSLLDAVGTLAYLAALFHIPLATATAINMATPILVTVLAVLVLKEHVGPGRWLAVVAGFAGVMLVVQPAGAGFDAFTLLCLAGTVLHAVRDFSTRLIERSIPSLLITLSSTVWLAASAAAWGLFEDWQPVSARHYLLLAAASVLLTAAYFLLVVAMRTGEMSVVAPFRYSGLVIAVVLGYLVWGAVPNALACAGIVLLVAAGVFMMRRAAPH